MDLATRNARKRLASRGAPYWQKIARGRALGYVATKNGRPGRWQVRLAVVAPAVPEGNFQFPISK